MFPDLLDYMTSAAIALICSSLCTALAVGLTWARLRNHFEHAPARPAVTSLACLMWALAANFGLTFISRLYLVRGDVATSLTIRNGFVGDVITLLVCVAIVAVFYTLAVLYPVTKPRDRTLSGHHDG